MEMPAVHEAARGRCAVVVVRLDEVDGPLTASVCLSWVFAARGILRPSHGHRMCAKPDRRRGFGAAKFRRVRRDGCPIVSGLPARNGTKLFTLASPLLDTVFEAARARLAIGLVDPTVPLSSGLSGVVNVRAQRLTQVVREHECRRVLQVKIPPRPEYGAALDRIFQRLPRRAGLVERTKHKEPEKLERIVPTLYFEREELSA